MNDQHDVHAACIRIGNVPVCRCSCYVSLFYKCVRFSVNCNEYIISASTCVNITCSVHIFTPTSFCVDIRECPDYRTQM